MLDKNTITNILTLRYDPLQKPVLPRLNWTDFKPTITPSTDLIKQSLKNSILENLENSKSESLTIALSAGIDSTLVLALLKNVLPNIKITALSIKFSNSIDETQQAKKIAKHFDVEHKIIILDNFLKNLPHAISIIGLPFWDIHWYYVVKEASKYSKYLVSGDGGDELFGGYTFRYFKFLSLIKQNSTPLEKVKAYLKCHERDSVPDQHELFGPQIDFDWNSIYDQLLPYFENSLDPLDQVFLADYNGKLLYNFSILNSKLHEHFKVQSITPLLSTNIISYFTQIKNSEKYYAKNNMGKLPLRKLLSDLGISELVSEKKQGFSVNTENLWTFHGYKLCNDFLTNSRIVSSGWINGDWIQKHLKKDNIDVRYINKFLGLLAFEIWYRIFITKEMKPKEELC